MKISILISSYNGENYIYEQLDSLRTQTRRPDEVVIADDCSTDHTVKLVKEYIDKYDLSTSWHLVINLMNKGWQKNFFDGIELTTGDLVFFCDQDDVWFDNKLEVYERLFENDTSINIISGHEVLWNGTSKENNHIQSDKGRRIHLDKTGKDYLIHCSGCAMAIRRTYYKKVKRYYVNGWAHDDFFWKMGILDGSFLLLDDNVILHRIHGTNESRKKRNYETSLQGFENEINVGKQLLKRLQKEKEINSLDSAKYIEHSVYGNQVRKRFFETKDPFDWIKLLIQYNDIYRRKRQMLGDLLLVYDLKKVGL